MTTIALFILVDKETVYLRENIEGSFSFFIPIKKKQKKLLAG